MVKRTETILKYFVGVFDHFVGITIDTLVLKLDLLNTYYGRFLASLCLFETAGYLGLEIK